MKHSTSFPQSASRRTFLKTVAKASAGAVVGKSLFNVFVPGAHAGTGPLDIPPAASGMNLILIITDQEREVQWAPPGWAAENLPAMTSLRASGVSFPRAYTNSCMCTPARNCLFTGAFPAQHRSVDTLSEGFPNSSAQHQLDPALPNLATVLKAAGYEVAYKGKWHLSHGVEGADGVFQDADIARYGFDQWNAPDAGQDVKIENYGGGLGDHDTRYADDAIAYLEHKRDNPGGKPFCLVISLVNPHDVLGYPGNVGEDGYTPADLVGQLELPPTVEEDLLANHKPTCQRELLAKLNGLGVLPTDAQKRAYLNFYGNLLKLVDGQIQRILDVFSVNFSEEALGNALRANTLIVRTSDHGEMAMAHGGMRQKTFNCYEETIRIPLVWSNPELFPEGRVCPHLVSHVDFLPTVCALLGVPDPASYAFAGVDYSSLVLDPAAPAVQDYVLFTFDDVNAGQSAEGTDGNGIVNPPNRLQMIRESDYKYVRYFDGEGIAADQQEFYDMRPVGLGTDTDPETGHAVEMRNLSVWAEGRRTFLDQPTLATTAQQAKRTQMANRLQDVTTARLQSHPLVSPVEAEDVTIRTVTVLDETTNEAHDMIELKFYSRWGSNYQLQRSTGLQTWTDVGEPIPGNNGPILLAEPLSEDRAFYRVVAVSASF